MISVTYCEEKFIHLNKINKKNINKACILESECQRQINYKNMITIFKEIRVNISIKPAVSHGVSILEKQLKMKGILNSSLAGMCKGSNEV